MSSIFFTRLRYRQMAISLARRLRVCAVDWDGKLASPVLEHTARSGLLFYCGLHLALL